MEFLSSGFHKPSIYTCGYVDKLKGILWTGTLQDFYMYFTHVLIKTSKGYMYVNIKNNKTLYQCCFYYYVYLLLYQITVSGVLPWSPFYPWKNKTNNTKANQTIINLQHVLLRIPLPSFSYNHVQHMVLTEHCNCNQKNDILCINKIILTITFRRCSSMACLAVMYISTCFLMFSPSSMSSCFAVFVSSMWSRIL